jgi:hypothetical protein
MGNFSPDPDGRPVQLNVWYPAFPQPNERQMTLGTYLDEAAPAAAFAPLTSIMRQRNQANWESSVPPAQLPALRATPTYAWAEARQAPGRFPTVLYFGGLNADYEVECRSRRVRCQPGYVVASISLTGPASTQTSQSRSPLGPGRVRARHGVCVGRCWGGV